MGEKSVLTDSELRKAPTAELREFVEYMSRTGHGLHALASAQAHVPDGAAAVRNVAHSITSQVERLEKELRRRERNQQIQGILLAAGGLVVVSIVLIARPQIIWQEAWTWPFLELCFGVSALIVISVYARPVYRWLSGVPMKRYLANAAVVLSVFVIAVFASRAWYNLRGDEPLLAGAAVTVIIVFLYWRIAKKFNL